VVQSRPAGAQMRANLGSSRRNKALAPNCCADATVSRTVASLTHV
jgi:hypothetical protein